MAIANIITNGATQFDNVGLFNISEDKILDINIPTLIIGWGLVKSIFGDKASILDKTIDKNICWTFSKFEKREDYEVDIINFVNKIISDKINTLNYRPINVFNITYNKIKDILKFLSSDIKKICYISFNKHIYFYSEEIIYGLSIEDLNYIGINKNKIFNKCRNMSIIYNSDFINDDFKRIINSNQIIIPYLYDNIKKI